MATEETKAVMAQMDAAADVAEAELRKTLEDNPEHKEGIMYALGWMRSHYMAAGYKRMGRTMVTLHKELGN